MLKNDIFDIPASAELVNAPTKGTLSLLPDGSFSYSPFSGEYGMDKFSYRPKAGLAAGEPVFVNLLLQDNPAPYIVTGKWTYNRTGGQAITLRPVRNAIVKVSDGTNTVIGTGVTDSEGRYAIRLESRPNSFTVEVFTIGLTGPQRGLILTKGSILAAMSGPFSARSNRLLTAPADQVEGADGKDVGIITIGDAEEREKAFWTFDALITSGKLLAVSGPPAVVTAYIDDWAKTSYGIREIVHIHPKHMTDWDTICHEFGHVASQILGFFPFANSGYEHIFELAPWSHSLEVNNRTLHGNLRNAMRLAFSEGIANFYSVVAQTLDASVPKGVNAVVHENGTSGDGLLYDITLNEGPPVQNGVKRSNGEDEEITVMRVLWDLYDGVTPNDVTVDRNLDQIALGVAGVFNAILGLPLPQPQGVARAVTLNELWRNLTAGRSAAQVFSVAAVFELNNVAPLIHSGETGMKVADAIATQWQEGDPIPDFIFQTPFSDVAAALPLLNTFRLTIINENGDVLYNAPINPVIDNSGSARFTPTAAEWAAVKAGGGRRAWFVQGRLSSIAMVDYSSSLLGFTIA